jgi:hypothetical protein
MLAMDMGTILFAGLKAGGFGQAGKPAPKDSHLHARVVINCHKYMMDNF